LSFELDGADKVTLSYEPSGKEGACGGMIGSTCGTTKDISEDTIWDRELKIKC
jgi:hypothetical protein